EDIPEAFGGVQRPNQTNDRKVRISVGLAGIHICQDRRGVEEDQRITLPMCHCLFEWNGNGWTNSTSPRPTPPRSKELGSVHWLPGSRNSGTPNQGWRKTGKNLRSGCSCSCADGRTGAVQRPRRYRGTHSVAAYL